MFPLNIAQENKDEIKIEWQNGHISIFKLDYLREQCPCAECKGETILLRTIRPPKKEKITEDMNLLKSIIPVGNYAIQICWKDGHDTGIYTWEYLLEIENKENANQSYNKLI